MKLRNGYSARKEHFSIEEDRKMHGIVNEDSNFFASCRITYFPLTVKSAHDATVVDVDVTNILIY